MTTDLQLTTTPAKFILGQDAMQTRVLDYLEKRASRVLATLWAEPGLIADLVGLTEGVTGTPAVAALSVDAGSYAGVVGDGGLTVEQEPFSFAHDDPGFANVPFDPTAGGGTVNVYLRPVKYPDLVAGAADGKYHLTGWKWGIGERAEPDAVNVSGPDLVFTIDAAIGGIPWATSDATRAVWVWLKVPAIGSTTSLVVQQGTCTSDGVNVKITLPSTTMGQGTPSTDPADYEVFVPGLYITDSAAEKTDPAYVFIGSVTATVHDTSDVVVHDLETLADFAEALLGQPFRPGIAMGHDAGVDWLDPANVTTDDNPGGGIDATLTFDDPDSHDTSGIAIATGGRMGTRWKAGGLVATLPGSSAADTYVVYAAGDPVGASGIDLELLITTDADFVATKIGVYLAIYQFTWDGSLGAGSRITAEAGADLAVQRGILHPKSAIGPGAAFDGNEATLGGIRMIPTDSAATLFSLARIFDERRRGTMYLRANETTVGASVRTGLQLYAQDRTATAPPTGADRRLRFLDDEDRPKWHFLGALGSVLGFAEDEGVAISFGGDDLTGYGMQWLIERVTGSDHEQITIGVDGDDTDIKRLVELMPGEGAAVQSRPTTDPINWVFKAPDFALKMTEDITTAGHYSGKLVVLPVPLVPWTEDSGAVAWVRSANLVPTFSGTAAGNDIYIPIPTPPLTGDGNVIGSAGAGYTGRAPKLVGLIVDIAIAANGGGDPAAGDGLDALIVSTDGTAITARSALKSYRFGADGRLMIPAFDGGLVADAIDGLSTGIDIDMEKVLFLKVDVTLDGAPVDTLRTVKTVGAVFRIYEFGH